MQQAKTLLLKSSNTLKEVSDKTFEILGQSIALGESQLLHLEISKLHTRTPVQVPIIVERAKKPGPVLLLMGGIHGDEMNGVEIVRQIIRTGLNKPERGTVIAIPVFNVLGFLNQSRSFPDGRDLNRMFPGSLTGSLASRYAKHFVNHIAPLIDYGIDFHTGGGQRENAPQVRCEFKDEKILELAQTFNAPYLINSKRIPKSVRDTLYKMGKQILLFEGGKTLSLHPPTIATGLRGTHNVMKHLNMIDGDKIERIESIELRKTRWLRAPTSGMFHVKVKNGTHARQGDILALVTDPFGEFEKRMRAPFDCHVFCVNTAPIINRGDAVFHVGLKPD